MGMYTEMHFNSELKKDVPVGVIEILQHMTGEKEEKPTELPKHPLFETSRWGWMFQCDSYYFDADTHSTLRWDDISQTFYLCLRFNEKNYDSEIEHFVDWIMPYLNKFDGDFLGFSRYEEYEEPTLIYYKDSNGRAQ